MEQHGNKTTYNIETVLRKNIVDSEYWRNTCAKLQTWEEIVDQIFYDVDHVEPWMSGNARGASSAFGLLYRLAQIQPSEEQVEALLTHEDSCYIRAVGRPLVCTRTPGETTQQAELQVGFLYLRYVGDPKQLWSWLRPYVRDPQVYSSNKRHKIIVYAAQPYLSCRRYGLVEKLVQQSQWVTMFVMSFWSRYGHAMTCEPCHSTARLSTLL